MERRGICVAGTLLADVFYGIPTFPQEGMLVQAKGEGLSIGGTGNIILDLAKLDSSLPVAALARLGDDEIADKIEEVLGEYASIDKSLIKRMGTSSRTLVMNSADTKQRTFFYIPAASDEFGFDDIPWDKLNSKIFLLEYLLLLKKADEHDPEYGTHAARILAEAKRRGMITSVDVVSEASDRAKTIVKAALKYTDICSVNELEASAVTGIDITNIGESFKAWESENNKKNLARCKEEFVNSPYFAPVREVFSKLCELGVSKYTVIHLRECAFGYDIERGEYYSIPSLNLPKGYVKGSTGAGDAYLSGILYGIHEGYTLPDAMKLARCTASASLSENNGTDGMRPLSEVRSLEELYG